jgi:hypothetical protein
LRFLRARKFDGEASKQMFVDCEKWRAETNLDEIVPVWDYPEKPEISKYYKQFYHKTDKVRATSASSLMIGFRGTLIPHRMAAPSTLRPSVAST